MDFLTRDDLPRAHWDETELSSTKYCNVWSLSNVFNILAFGFSYLIITYTLGCICTQKYISYYILMFFKRASYNVSRQNSNIYAPCIYIQMWRWASDISWSHPKGKYPVFNEPKCCCCFFFVVFVFVFVFLFFCYFLFFYFFFFVIFFFFFFFFAFFFLSFFLGLDYFLFQLLSELCFPTWLFAFSKVCFKLSD